MDRSEINRALAKAIAYKQCGKDAKARYWAAQLVSLLECNGILDDSYIRGEYVATMKAA
jgi:hypothetical protein